MKTVAERRPTSILTNRHSGLTSVIPAPLFVIPGRDPESRKKLNDFRFAFFTFWIPPLGPGSGSE